MPSLFQFDTQATRLAVAGTDASDKRPHNAEKVAAMRAAIAEGHFVVNASAIADKLVATDTLSKTTEPQVSRRVN